jgi:hypothetical protein
MDRAAGGRSLLLCGLVVPFSQIEELVVEEEEVL